MAQKKLYKEVTVKSAQTAQTPATQRMYRGISTVNPDNTTFSLNDIGLIKQDLLNHFHISQGEKLENPEFGTIIWDLLMDPATGQVEKLVKEDIQKILTRDPRVSEKKVKVLVLDNSISAEVVIDVIPFNSVETLYLNYTQQNEEGGGY